MKVHELIEHLRTRNLDDEIEVETIDIGIISDEMLTVLDVSFDSQGHTVLYIGEDE